MTTQCPNLTSRFVWQCLIGSARDIVTLIEKHGEKIDIHSNHEQPFYYICRRNEPQLVKWMLSLEDVHGPINIHVRNCLEAACCASALETVDILLSLEPTHGPHDITRHHHRALQTALENEKICNRILEKYSYEQLKDFVRTNAATRNSWSNSIQHRINAALKDKGRDRLICALKSDATRTAKK